MYFDLDSPAVIAIAIYLHRTAIYFRYISLMYFDLDSPAVIARPRLLAAEFTGTPISVIARIVAILIVITCF